MTHFLLFGKLRFLNWLVEEEEDEVANESQRKPYKLKVIMGRWSVSLLQFSINEYVRLKIHSQPHFPLRGWSGDKRRG